MSGMYRSQERPPGEPPSTGPPAQHIGECIHVDILPLKGKSLGGHTCAFLAVDEKTGYLSLIPLSSKHAPKLLEAIQQIVGFFKSHGHTVGTICSDSESVLKALEVHLGHMGIKYVAAPPDAHEKRVERYVQTLKRRRDAMLATLSYEMPAALEAEVLVQAVALLNQTSNKVSRPSTPLQLVTGRKPFPPQFNFGQVGLFYSKKRDNPNVRAEWGIFLGHNGHPKSLRAYIPLAQAVYVRRKFVAHHHIPSVWNLRVRLRPLTPARRVLSTAGGLIIPDFPILLPPPVPTPIPSNARSSPMDNSIPLTEQEARVTTTPPPLIPPSPAPAQSPTPTQAQEGAKDWEGAKRSPAERDDPASSVGLRRNPPRKAATNSGWLHGRHEVRAVSDCTSVYRISMRAAMRMANQMPEINEAAIEEINNMLKNRVMVPTYLHHLAEGEKSIPAHMFFTLKTRADGTFSKVNSCQWQRTRWRDYWRDVCSDCERYLHDDPIAAYSQQWSHLVIP